MNLGVDYKFVVSFLFRPTHAWQWPVRTSTGWCFGRVGVHMRKQVNRLLQ